MLYSGCKVQRVVLAISCNIRQKTKDALTNHEPNMDKQDQNRDNQVQNRAAGTEQGQLGKNRDKQVQNRERKKALKQKLVICPCWFYPFCTQFVHAFPYFVCSCKYLTNPIHLSPLKSQFALDKILPKLPKTMLVGSGQGRHGVSCLWNCIFRNIVCKRFHKHQLILVKKN